MKKLLLAVSAIALSLTANAQFWAGGSLGFNATNYDYDDAKTQVELSLSPVVGYALNENMDVYLGLSFGSTSNYAGYEDQKRSNVSIAPFLRYTFFEIGDFGLFVDGGLNFTLNKDERPDLLDPNTTRVDKTKHLFVGLIPGIKYAANEKLTFVAGLGRLGFNSTLDYSSTFGFDFGTTGLTFGAYYSF